MPQLDQILSERDAFVGVKGGVCPIYYLGLALDGGGTEFQSSTIVE